MQTSQETLRPGISPTQVTDRLLVVDDDPSNIENLRWMLGKHGFEILPAPNGDQAVDCLTESAPDLILLKLVVSAEDGIKLCKRIQENAMWADIPIVFFSTTHDKDQVARALESGGVDFLAQPFSKQELLSRIRTHLMLKTTRDHLKHLAREKEELLGMISHHVQNHLAGINMSARLLAGRLKDSSDARSRLLADNLARSSGEMSVFIKSLLANTAADRRFCIKLECVHLSDAALNVVRQYEDAARGKELMLRLIVHEGGGPIRADASALEQVLDNLISNAVKFSPPKSEISVVLQPTVSHMECLVQDQGPGFTDEDRLRMFHRYARLSARPTGGEPSTGLGLSITQRLVRAMEGELICRSTPGQGSTFIVRFPLHRQEG